MRVLHARSTDWSTVKRRLTGTNTALSQYRSSANAHGLVASPSSQSLLASMTCLEKSVLNQCTSRSSRLPPSSGLGCAAPRGGWLRHVEAGWWAVPRGAHRGDARGLRLARAVDRADLGREDVLEHLGLHDGLTVVYDDHFLEYLRADTTQSQPASGRGRVVCSVSPSSSFAASA